MKFKISLIAALIFSVVFSTAAFAARSATLINRTGRDIEAIYVSPVAEDEWERYYGDDDFEDGDSIRIYVSSSERFWDIRCRYTNGRTETWYGVELSGTVTLRRDGEFSTGSSGRRYHDDYDDWNDKRY